jgi:hypothetical protein
MFVFPHLSFKVQVYLTVFRFTQVPFTISDRKVKIGFGSQLSLKVGVIGAGIVGHCAVKLPGNVKN